MRILFDYQAFEMQRIGGVSRSYAELISHLREIGCECKLGLKESDNVYIQNEDIKPLYYTHYKLFGQKKRFLGQRTTNKIILRLMGYPNEGTTVNQDYCIKLLKQKEFDIFEPTFFDSYFLPYLNGKPFVMTVHDMIPELFPKYFGKNGFQIEMKKQLCPRASAIHVPSQKTKEDLINILNIIPEKITIIPHGAANIQIPKSIPQRVIKNPYILYIGDRYKYKNFDLLLREMAIILQTEPDLNLVCTGHHFSEEERYLIANLNLKDRVHHCFASDDNFYSLYNNAVAFVYPSSYEGFGLPILEAWSCDCPVMLNNASCFPEVGGDAAIYFDINKKGDLAEHITSFYRISSEDRSAIISKGKNRLSLFSWEKSALQLKRVYESIS